MKFGVITDEVSQNLEEAADFAVKYGLQALEIRSVENKSPFEITIADAKRIREIADAHQLEIAAISAPLFKCSIRNEKAVKAHIEGFSHCAALSKIFGSQIIRGFDFWAEGASLEERAAAYAPIIRICEEQNLLCAIEYDPSVHSSTPQKLLPLLQTINDPHIGALYDPGNGIFSDPNSNPYPTDYQLLKPFIRHIHIKDAVRQHDETTAVKVGTGQVDYRGLFSRLKADGYDGAVMLETHYRKNKLLSEQQLKTPGGNLFSDGAYEASAESASALLQIWEEIL